MFEPTILSSAQRQRCLDTVSTNVFYLIVMNALLQREALSVVRMGDGEKLLMDWCEDSGTGPEELRCEEWINDLGISGLPKSSLKHRMLRAANECTWFAPSISGIIREDYELYSRFNPRDRYVDNFWCNAWDEGMKVQLFKIAGSVLFIHRNAATADAMQIRAKYGIDVPVRWLKLDDWMDSERVIIQAVQSDAPLVLFSGGPAGKYIGPVIATTGSVPKVVLDLGNAADHWTLPSMAEAAQGRR